MNTDTKRLISILLGAVVGFSVGVFGDTSCLIGYIAGVLLIGTCWFIYDCL